MAITDKVVDQMVIRAMAPSKELWLAVDALFGIAKSSGYPPGGLTIGGGYPKIRCLAYEGPVHKDHDSILKALCHPHGLVVDMVRDQAKLHTWRTNTGV